MDFVKKSHFHTSKILLVYPEIPTTYWGFKYALKFIGKKASLPPLGLCTVAALLPEHFECRLVDMNVSKLRHEDILWADMVFISAMLIQKTSFEEVVRRCNALKRPVVAGGPFPTSQHTVIEGVDHFVLNEAEINLPLFLEDLERGTAGRVYNDTARADMSKTPVPRLELLDIKRYNSLALQFSRGCPFSCEFCDIIEMFGRVPRTKPAAHFLAEMDRILELGFKGSIFVVDDNFIGNAGRVKELLREIEAWQAAHGKPFSFFTEASVNLAQDDELLDLMVRAGFEMVFLGIESPAEESLQSAGKRQNLHGDLLGSVEKIQRAGLEVCGGFIVGFDTDTGDIFGRQFDFIQSSAIPSAMVGLLMALPNTRLYKRLESENRLLHVPSGNNTHDVELNFIPTMDRSELLKGYKGMIFEIYSPRNYFSRCLKLIKRLPSRVKSSRSIHWNELRAFALSLVRQSFSSYGIHYLGFLLKTMRSRAGLFPEAIALAIKGHHFFKITRDMLAADRFKRILQEKVRRLEGYIEEMLRRYNAGLPHSVAKTMEQLQTLPRAMRRRYGRLSGDSRACVRESLLAFEKQLAILGRRVSMLNSQRPIKYSR